MLDSNLELRYYAFVGGGKYQERRQIMTKVFYIGILIGALAVVAVVADMAMKAAATVQTVAAGLGGN